VPFLLSHKIVSEMLDLGTIIAVYLFLSGSCFHCIMEKKRLIFYLLTFLVSAANLQVSAFNLSHKIDSIHIVVDPQQLILPGESFTIGVIAYSKNGKVSKTKGMINGSVFWWNYKVEVTGGTFLSGRVSVNKQSQPSTGQTISIKAYPRKQPELARELAIPLNYETRITFRPTTQFDKAPGSQVKGEVLAEFDNGMQRIYDDLRSRKESVFYQFYGISASWGKGRFTIEPDITKIDMHSVSLITTSIRTPAVSDTFSILLDYNHKYELYLSGWSGSKGFSGSGGTNGANGWNGSDGQSGQNGEFGSDGPDIGVWADLYYDSILNCNLLYVFAEDLSTHKEYRYLLNPEGSSLKVSSVGGSGGAGGDGGDGGAGGNGRQGEIHVEKHMEKQIVSKTEKRTVIKKEKKIELNSEGKEVEIEVDVPVTEDVTVNVEVDVEVCVNVQEQGEAGGDGGWGGAGGFGGIGGYGGNITIYLTDDARPYLSLILPVSEGGSGGKHGNGGLRGRGGNGGYGNPSGRNGIDGYDGPSAIGWAESGGSGSITVKSTEEFLQYSDK
jgi:hypothetical protein